MKKQNFWMGLVSGVENACKPVLDKVEKWTEEKRKASEMKMKLIEKELELIEAELRLEEVIEDMDEELKRREKEEEKVEMGLQKEEDTSALANQDEKPLVEEDEEEEEEDEDDVAPSSFGSVTADQDATKNGQKGNKPGKSPFSTSSLAFASSSFVSGVSSEFFISTNFFLWVFISSNHCDKSASLKIITCDAMIYASNALD